MILINFKVNTKYKDCLDVNYNPIYLNRYVDSLLTTNTIEYNNKNKRKKIYFNFFDIYNNDLNASIFYYIQNNIDLNDASIGLLFRKLITLKEEVLFNNKIVFIHNIDEYLYCNNNLNSLENYIREKIEPKSYIVIKSKNKNFYFNNYIPLGNNFYIKKLF